MRASGTAGTGRQWSNVMHMLKESTVSSEFRVDLNDHSRMRRGAGYLAKWVKFCAVCFGSPGFTGSDPGCRSIPLISHAVEATHIQNRGRLARMSAQGKSSSEKKHLNNANLF